MTAQEKQLARFEKGFHICVGLDTDIEKIPKHLLSSVNPVLEFNKRIIEATAADASAFKVNFAFYERDGIVGLQNLLETIQLIPEDIPIIGDAKRGDIGNTSQMYAKAVFESFHCDAVTLHPYMGIDSVQPFLDYSDKISYILALTSNKSSADFEKLKLLENEYVYESIISKTNHWNTNKNCGIVFGATNPEELKSSIENFGDLFVLLPGVGAQGGSLEDGVNIFNSKNNPRFLVNVSRGLIYADGSEYFAETAANKLKKFNKICASVV